MGASMMAASASETQPLANQPCVSFENMSRGHLPQAEGAQPSEHLETPHAVVAMESAQPSSGTIEATDQEVDLEKSGGPR